MSTQPIDYAALAKQAGAVSSAPPQVDYSALAKQAGAVSSTPAPPIDKTKRSGSFLQRLGILPSEEELNNIPIGKDEQAGPSVSGSPGELLNQGLTEGSKELAKTYVKQGPMQVGSGVADVAHGDIAKGGHKIISGAGITLLPLAPEAIAANPAMALRAAGGGILAGKAAEAGTKAAGGDEDQQQFANDLGNLGGGTIAGTGAIRAVLGTPTKALISAAAEKASSSISPELMDLLPGKIPKFLSYLSKAGKMVDSLDPKGTSGLGDIVTKHADKIADLGSQLNDALSKANALPPEGPTAKAIDVPDLRVQPAQQAPQNLMEARKAAFQRAQAQAQGGTFQVVPPDSATPAAPAAASNTPKGAMYDEPIQEKTAQQIFQGMPKKPPSLIDQLKQWDNIRQIHAQLEDQIGKGQDEIQSWMDEHNQEAPGAKPPGAAATAKARFDAARAAAESRANAIETDAPQGGHAGNGVSSVEELSRPGKNYVVTKSGALTYQGKSFAPESTPNGATHVTVLPDGSFRVNAGPQLNPSQTAALKASQPRVPTSDEDVESLLMKSIQNAQAKRSAKASD